MCWGVENHVHCFYWTVTGTLFPVLVFTAQTLAWYPSLTLLRGASGA